MPKFSVHHQGSSLVSNQSGLHHINNEFLSMVIGSLFAQIQQGFFVNRSVANGIGDMVTNEIRKKLLTWNKILRA